MTPVPDERIVESLHQLGFSMYEARLYLGLLTGGPQNGNELSRTSGVPSSKVYAMLERLAAEGLVARSQRKNTVEYVCVPPQDLLHKLRARYSQPLTFLEETLPTIGRLTPDPDILHVQGVDAIVDNARAIVRGTSKEIFLSVWQEFADDLGVELSDAEKRGVRIAGMIYGTETPAMGWWQQHSYRETVATRIGGRMLTMAADGREALIAHIPDQGEASAVRTTSPVLTLIAEEYLIHDLTLQKAKTMTGYAEWDEWLRADKQLQMLTLGRTGRLSPIEAAEKRPPARRRRAPAAS